MLGRHCIKGWAKTQAVIAKSSAESELYSVIKGSCEALGMQTLAKDFGDEFNIRLYLDASAAKGILERSGISKIRHIDVNQLWLQEVCARKLIPAIKVDGTDNPSDLLTKHLTSNVIDRHLKFLDIEYREGRSDKAAKLHEVSRAERKIKYEDKMVISSFQSGQSDRWEHKGEEDKWSRRHTTARRALFTPYKVAKGPGRKTKLLTMRITEGVYENGQKFKLIDDWTKPSESHRLLEADWIGRTIFKVDLKEDVSLGGDYRRQRRRAFTSSAAPSIHHTVNTSKVSWADIQDSDESDSR